MTEIYSNKRIIVAPLFWGLGHATRCIPIINSLNKNNTVAIASDGEALQLLQKEFPNLERFELPSYNIRYTFDSMIANMIIQGPGSLITIKKEQKSAETIAQEWNADVLVSDNRFGFRSDQTENIYITHQLNIPANNPLISSIASRAHRKIISKFDQCWVPDFKGKECLAGKLSQVNLKTPTKYLGPLSRMQKAPALIKYDFIAVLSGPEPQRTKFEQLIVQSFNKAPKLRFCLVRGTSSDRENIATNENVEVFDLLETKSLNQLMNASSHIICRSGYTSIMDLVKLEKSATFIPTPGQYEQEYLAKRLDGKYGFDVCEQKDCVPYLNNVFDQSNDR